ncbi:hypothetical protein [Haliangium sp.]|uniref:hypothetical protein n=1 Tax=Haliangium sp. TaxID=2663208 RepID=UPI003D11B227
MKISTEVQLGAALLSNSVSVRVHRCMGAVAGLCEIAVPASVDVSAAPGDDLVADLGPADQAGTVFTGTVDAVEARGAYTVFRALDSRVDAARTRVNEIFSDTTTDSVMSDLADAAGLTVGDLAKGVNVVTYLADDGRSVLGHLVHLAELGGCHLYVDVDGALQALAYTPAAPAWQIEYGGALIAVTAAARRGGGPVEVRTEGAASTNGPDAAYWPTTDTSAVAGVMQAGDLPGIKLWRPELRSMADATLLAASTSLRRLQRSRRVDLRCLGLAEIELGDGVMVQDVPGADASLLLRTVAVEHRANAWEGFITELGLEGVGT